MSLLSIAFSNIKFWTFIRVQDNNNNNNDYGYTKQNKQTNEWYDLQC